MLPNVTPRPCRVEKKTQSVPDKVMAAILSLPFLEVSMRIWQQRSIHTHRTTETVTSHFLAFHPHDYRQKTLRRFTSRQRRFATKGAAKPVKASVVYIDKEKNIFYTA
jgi:hypothetical protein